jgi:signal transduction histidine kinase
VFFAGLVILIQRASITPRYAHQVAAAMAQVVLGNSLLHLSLTGEIYQTTNILLLIVGVACFCLSVPGFVFVLATALVGWGLIMWSLPPSPDWLHFGFAVFAATVLALLIFYVRLRIHQRLERLRIQDTQQKSELEHALAAAQEVDRLKDDLISTVSHELRTPLTSLLGFTELMLERDFPQAQQRDLLSIMHRESLRLTNLINNFLDLQVIASGHSRYHFVETQLTPLLHEAVSLFAQSDGKHEWKLSVPEVLPPVHIDTERIYQVLANLVSNAVKFSPQSGTITVGAELQPTMIKVWVTDQGMGIPVEALPHLFTKFFRVDNEATRTVGGTGPGLALVKEIIEAHQGQVWVESTLGKGSTFSFTLPLTPQLAQDREQPSGANP